MLPIRNRMHRREIPGNTRFITFSCQHRLPLLARDNNYLIFRESLRTARLKHGFELFAWVAMPEHVHLVCRPRLDASLRDALKSLKMSVTKQVLEPMKARRDPMLTGLLDSVGRPRFWLKGGGHDHNVRDIDALSRHVHRNPVERGLVTRPEDWPWSSVRWWMRVPLDSDMECDPPPDRSIAWELWKGYM
jgi:putative transposase